VLAGQVILTTCRGDAALSGPGRTRVDLDVFTPEESLLSLDGKLAQGALARPESMWTTRLGVVVLRAGG